MLVQQLCTLYSTNVKLQFGRSMIVGCAEAVLTKNIVNLVTGHEKSASKTLNH